MRLRASFPTSHHRTRLCKPRWIGLYGLWPQARFRRQDPGLITPRDFDLSPYFEIVKFNHLGDSRFSYRDIVWEETAEATTEDSEKPTTDETAATG